MKLELKHLAPYLPYGLKGWAYSEIRFNNLSYIDVGEFSLSIGNVSDMLDQSLFCGCKPILRPLSDLTKEIEVNGERFIPILDLAKLHQSDFRSMNPYSTNHCHACTNGSLHRFGYNINKKSFFLYFDGEEDGFCGLSNQIEMFQKLFEWHFDVFGLIKENLAIDINTLKI